MNCIEWNWCYYVSIFYLHYFILTDIISLFIFFISVKLFNACKISFFNAGRKWIRKLVASIYPRRMRCLLASGQGTPRTRSLRTRLTVLVSLSRWIRALKTGVLGRIMTGRWDSLTMNIRKRSVFTHSQILCYFTKHIKK